MKKKIAGLIIVGSLLILSLTSCSLIGFGGAKTTTPPKSTTTSSTLIERIQALESQNLSLNTQINKLNSDVAELQSKLAADEKTIADLKK